MEKIRRVFVEKKPGFDVAANHLFHDLKGHLHINALEGVRIIIRYDAQGLSDEDFEAARLQVFSEPPVDEIYNETFPIEDSESQFAIEYLPGQYDQRADSAAQSIQIITHKEAPIIKAAQVIVLKGNLSDQDMDKIKKYLVNPVDSRIAADEKPASLTDNTEIPADVASIDGFITNSETEMDTLRNELGLAMSQADILHCQKYFRDEENRNPTITEIRMLDTYWSDHCRHTTFLTHIKDVSFQDSPLTEPIKKTYEEYKSKRDFVYGENTTRPESLMDIALMGMKDLRKRGLLDDLEVSDEVNACSIVVKANLKDENGNDKVEEWLVMFKNETHNHPTEIEPFGGAATCLGGAIRDPLSGRSYVYQAMRVTGAGDPRQTIEDTLPGKLPQRKITTESAHGYSSYGNQIGLATGIVHELYHPGYIAKRMEIGAVIAAAPRENVFRGKPSPGDIVVLVGGRTGRDGCGGATGSSKSHTEESISTSGAEVQKGNPPTERKIQRLFRIPEVSKMIKVCNDFGAGGVSVAIGEIADGLKIDLDAVPKKYQGLDGTELAISESQERMAVLLNKEDVEKFIKYSEQENLEAVTVAEVTEEARVRINWRGKQIVDMSRAFIDTNGVIQDTVIEVAAPTGTPNFAYDGDDPASSDSKDTKALWLKNLSNLNVCSQKGLIEMFDSTIGAGSVLLPFGGKNQSTPAESMVAKLPILSGDSSTGTVMSHGFNPFMSSWSPYHGAVYAVLESVSKVVAAGGDYSKVRLTLQEYFEKLGTDPVKWGKPFSALLGALKAQEEFGIAAIGGKDSMSGTFENISVPPTLCSFAVAPVDVNAVVSPEFKSVNSTLVYLPAKIDETKLPDFDAVKTMYSKVTDLIGAGKIISAHTVKQGGISAALAKMTFGNTVGAEIDEKAADCFFSPYIGSIIIETKESPESVAALLDGIDYSILGKTIADKEIRISDVTIPIDELFAAWENTLEDIFPSKTDDKAESIPEMWSKPASSGTSKKASTKAAKPKVFIPVFPGTNCEYDTARQFEAAGAEADIFVFNNLTPSHLDDSLKDMAKRIDDSQIIMIPGGFSAGDEPEGSGKFIAAAFSNPIVKDAVMNMLNNRDGLMLGICNGFQALIKLGLLPYGEIRSLDENSPTLTFNKIGRHVSQMVYTRTGATNSPWLNNIKPGDMHSIAVSHGEGRFVAKPQVLDSLAAANQIAFQYVDLAGNPTAQMPFNPNGSMMAIEGITSPDGRILGKMGHSERIGSNVAKNIIGEKDQKLFEAGVAYFQ